jgi:3-oxoacyl-[acyl-carrier-protein] synthase-3
MYIRALQHYIPQLRVATDYFTDYNGKSVDWMHKRTGIQTRTRAGECENTRTMAVSALKSMPADQQQALKDVDLIVGATYTPFDTIYTLAHAVQRELGASRAQVLTLSSACSSFVNAMEVVEGYFATGKAHSALVVVSEHNSAYNHDEDARSGHLWGDGAAVVWVTADSGAHSMAKVLSMSTRGGATMGKSATAVTLQPKKEGLQMPHGRDVFVHAVTYMEEVLRKELVVNNYNPQDLAYVVPHQANQRISKQLAHQLRLSDDQLLSTIEKYGNTGAAGAVITLSENAGRFNSGDLIGITVFGGGYSMGAMLLEWL